MTSSFCLPAVLNPPLTGREAVTDAMYRCAIAFDTNDATLFDASFMPDGVFEVNGRAMKGLPEIHAIGLALIFKLDTTHMITNVRVHMKTGTTKAEAEAEAKENEQENEASLTATVLSQHYAGGKGMELGEKSLMGGSFYQGDLVRDTDGLWKFKYLRVKASWLEGHISVIGGDFADKEQQ